MVEAFYADYELSHVESRLQAKMEEYRKPQDDSHRNYHTVYGNEFNGLVKAIAEKVRFRIMKPVR